MGAPSSHNEIERLVALARYDILDSPPEEAFDNITKLAAEVLQVPVAALNFITDDRHWCKSAVGAEPSSLPRELSPCAVTIAEGQLLEVQDPAHDPRFAQTLLTAANPPFGLYAGAPLMTEDGHAIGTLCIMDSRSRPLTERDRSVLERLARMAMDELELRAARHRLEIEAQARSQMLDSMRHAGQMSDVLAAVSTLADLDLELPELIHTAADLLTGVVELDWLGLFESTPEGLNELFVWRKDAPDPTWPQSGPLAGPLAQTARGVLEAGTALFEDDLDPSFPQSGQPRAAAWLPLIPPGAARHLLAGLRFGHTRTWRRRERTLLETAARSISRGIERREHLRRAERRARSDELTGLANLRAFHLDLETRLSQGKPFGLVMLDLDRFRDVNEEQGMARGDILLRLFAQALSAQWRVGDVVYRLGGDELAVLIGGAQHWPSAELLEDWALEQVDVAVSVARLAGFGNIGASSGLALYPADAFEGKALIEHADRRMYLAKRSRKLRRTPAGRPSVASEQLQDLRINPEQHEAQYRGLAVRLRPKESELLTLLTRDPDRIFSREELAGRLWEGETPPSGNVLEVHLTNLRKKLSGIAPHIKIRAVRGQGYNLVVEAE